MAAKKKSTVNKAGNTPNLPCERTCLTESKQVLRGVNPVSGQHVKHSYQRLSTRKRVVVIAKDPRVGTGKKPKGSGRRLYTDENPKDTVSIKYATIQDAKDTIAKVKRISKPYARKIQILTVLEQRAAVQGKTTQSRLAKQAKVSLKRKHDATKKGKKQKGYLL